MNRIWLATVVRELVAHRSRTMLTVLSIAVGLFAVSLTFRTQAILSRNVLDVYATTEPAAIIVQVQPSDPQIVKMLRRIDGIAAAEGINHISARALIGTNWQALALIGVEDMRAMQVNRLAPAAGVWPAPLSALLIERSFSDQSALQIGNDLTIELENGQQQQLPIAGSARDLTVISGRLGNPIIQGYVTLATAERLTGSWSVNEFQIAVAPSMRDPVQLRVLAERVRTRLNDAGATVLGLRIRDPTAPDTYAIIAAVFQLLNALGLLSLVLSACLVINTTSAILARHVAQIGIMKAIGARSQNVFGIYLSMILLIALAAMLLALPLAGLSAWLLAKELAWLLNYDIQDLSVPFEVIAIEIAAGIAAPLLASAIPIGMAARITVREALSEGRAGTLSARSQQSVPLPGVPVSILYAARSMFRRKTRLVLTLVALACGGAIEIAVISTQASLGATLEQVTRYWQQDLTVSLNQPMSVLRVTNEARQVAGVVGVEIQPATLAVRQRPNGTDSEGRYAIYGVQPNSSLLTPTLLSGRWLQPDDTDAIVINVDLVKREGLALGDQLTIKVGERSTTWRVVGVVTSHLLIYGEATIGQGVGYISSDAFMQQLNRAQRTNRIIVVTAQHDAAFRAQVGQALTAHFAQIKVQALVQTYSDIQGQISGFVSLIVILLMVMAFSFVAIGALSLIGAMSLNVLERTREVGVLRAIGSAHRHIATIVIVEGVCIGALSWVPATLLALPLSRMLSDTLGWSILSWPLVYIFPPTAPLLWIGLVVLLAAGASYLPAQRAATMNVRDALDYR